MKLKFSTWLECGTPPPWALGWVVRPGTSSVLQRLKEIKAIPNSLNFVTASKLLLQMLLSLGLFDLVAHSKSKVLAKLVVLWGWMAWGHLLQFGPTH